MATGRPTDDCYMSFIALLLSRAFVLHTDVQLDTCCAQSIVVRAVIRRADKRMRGTT